MDILISYHQFLVKALLFVLFFNMILPFFIKKYPIKAILWVRIGYYLFWAAFSMAVFSGLIVWVFMKNKIDLAVILMMILAFILPILDIYRAIKLRRFWLENREWVKFNFFIALLELILTVGVVIVAVVR